MAEPARLDGSRVLVTGGAGFIGSNFVHHFLRRFPDAHVVVLDALTYAGRRENLDGIPTRSLTFMHGDIRDPAAVALAMEGCDYVLNFAAESHVDRSIEAPGRLHPDRRLRRVRAVRGGAPARAQALPAGLDRRGLRRGARGRAPPRTGRCMPRSPYAASKAGGDRLAFAYWATYGLPVVVTRCTNNYGPRQYPEKLVPLFVTNAIEGQPLPVYGTGLNRRDWIHVEDHCSALVTLLTQPGIEGETFNIGAGNELDVLTITGTILRLLGKPESLVRHVEDRPGHDRRYALDSSRLTRLTGWKPAVAFEDGIRQTVEWYRANEAWWRPIKEGEFRAYYERMYGTRKVLKEVRE